MICVVASSSWEAKDGRRSGPTLVVVKEVGDLHGPGLAGRCC